MSTCILVIVSAAGFSYKTVRTQIVICVLLFFFFYRRKRALKVSHGQNSFPCIVTKKQRHAWLCLHSPSLLLDLGLPYFASGHENMTSNISKTVALYLLGHCVKSVVSALPKTPSFLPSTDFVFYWIQLWFGFDPSCFALEWTFAVSGSSRCFRVSFKPVVLVWHHKHIICFPQEYKWCS